MTDPTYAQAASPATSAELLAKIAYERPDLRAVVAANPSAYPELLTWLGSFGDPAIDAAVRSRGGAGPQGLPQQASAQQPGAQPGYPQPGYGQGYAQPAPYGPGVVPPANEPGQDYLVGTAHQPQRTSRRGVIVGVSVAAGALLLGGGAYAANELIFSKLGGAETPDAAVTQLVEGLAAKDSIAIYGSLSPAEIDQTRAQLDSFTAAAEAYDEYEDIAADYGRIIDALDIELSGLTLSTEPVAQGVTKVYLTGGELTVDADVDAIADAIVDVYSGVLESSLIQQIDPYSTPQPPSEVRAEIVEDLGRELPATVSTSDLQFQGDDAFLVAVEEDGSWYVSPYLTVAEYAYLDGGLGPQRGSLPDPAAVQDFGSPEEAAAGLTDAVVEYVRSGDIDTLVNVLPLAERRVLALYATGDEFAGVGDGVDVVTLLSNTFATDSVKDGIARVVFDGFALRVDADGETADLALTGSCITFAGGPVTETEICLDEAPLIKEFGLQDLALIAVQEDGSWFVSPTSTLVDTASVLASRSLALYQAGHLQDDAWLEQQMIELQSYLMAKPGLAPLLLGSGF